MDIEADWSLVYGSFVLNVEQIKLNRQLSRRPTIHALIEKGVLPAECYLYHSQGSSSRLVAPALVETKRKIERERIKDVLRNWVGKLRDRTACATLEAQEPAVDVQGLAKRFGAWAELRQSNKPIRWGERSITRSRDLPTRAKVLGLRRFWERVGRGYDPAAMAWREG